MPGNVAPSDVVRYSLRENVAPFDALVYVRMYMYIRTRGRHPGARTHTHMGVRAVSSVIRAM